MASKIKRLRSELANGTKTNEEFKEGTYDAVLTWARDNLNSVLFVWAIVGLPSNQFDATAIGFIKHLAAAAEERVKAEEPHQMLQQVNFSFVPRREIAMAALGWVRPVAILFRQQARFP